jgi:16S rRNA (guanine(966)-N(2))-methyltransferase RsmD
VTRRRGEAAQPATRPRGAPGEVRLIGGRWKRSRLPVPEVPGLRPTPDRVRETLFNWLGQDLTGWRCADAFAGTGALGLEAASRGAAPVVLVERDAGLVRRLDETVRRLGGQGAVEVCRGDAVSWLSRVPAGSLDLVFLDPPYDSTLLADALPFALQALVPGGWVYAESSTALAVLPDGCSLHRSLRAGQVHAQLLCKVPAAR